MIGNIDLSSYSLDELHKLSARIHQEIERQQQTKVLSIRTEMEELAGHLGMTVEEVVGNGKKRKASKLMSQPKYQNPEDPRQTWSGRGKRPRWLQHALSQGAQLEDFAI
jgi:DNA-binding protein H-NS